jgi:hypothetical protein
MSLVEGQVTPARVAASQANGKKSQGPKTPEGKARSSLNSLKTGAYAKTDKPPREMMLGPSSQSAVASPPGTADSAPASRAKCSPPSGPFPAPPSARMQKPWRRPPRKTDPRRIRRSLPGRLRRTLKKWANQTWTPWAKGQEARVRRPPDGTAAVAGRTQPLIRRIVTPMVELRKLKRELINFFPDPSAEPVWQTKGLFETRPVLRPFWCYKIVQESCKSVQKSAKACKK